jgi:hypothetical protein
VEYHREVFVVSDELEKRWNRKELCVIDNVVTGVCSRKQYGRSPITATEKA